MLPHKSSQRSLNQSSTKSLKITTTIHNTHSPMMSKTVWPEIASHNTKQETEMLLKDTTHSLIQTDSSVQFTTKLIQSMDSTLKSKENHLVTKQLLLNQQLSRLSNQHSSRLSIQLQSLLTTLQSSMLLQLLLTMLQSSMLPQHTTTTKRPNLSSIHHEWFKCWKVIHKNLYNLYIFILKSSFLWFSNMINSWWMLRMLEYQKVFIFWEENKWKN